jgi:hypothetical protein
LNVPEGYQPAYVDGKLYYKGQDGTLVPAQPAAKPIEVSPGASLFDPNTGKSIFTAPTAKMQGGGTSGRAGSGSGGRGSTGNPVSLRGESLSPQAKAVMNGTLNLEDLTPTQRGKIAGELASAGYQRANNVGATQRESIADFDTLLREAGNASALVDKVNTGPIAGRLGSVGSKFGLADRNFNDYSSVISNFSSILLRLRSGAAVTPQEYERIAGFIPTLTDDEKTAKQKIERFMKETKVAQQDYVKRQTQTSQQLKTESSNDPLGILK